MHVGKCGLYLLMVLSLFCRLSGLSPFLGETDAETMNFIVNCSWDFDADTFEGLSEEAKDFVSRLLVKEKRYLSSLVTHGDPRSGSWAGLLTVKVFLPVDKFRSRFLSLLLLWKNKGNRERDKGNK